MDADRSRAESDSVWEVRQMLEDLGLREVRRQACRGLDCPWVERALYCGNIEFLGLVMLPGFEKPDRAALSFAARRVSEGREMLAVVFVSAVGDGIRSMMRFGAPSISPLLSPSELVSASEATPASSQISASRPSPAWRCRGVSGR